MRSGMILKTLLHPIQPPLISLYCIRVSALYIPTYLPTLCRPLKKGGWQPTLKYTASPVIAVLSLLYSFVDTETSPVFDVVFPCSFGTAVGSLALDFAFEDYSTQVTSTFLAIHAQCSTASFVG